MRICVIGKPFSNAGHGAECGIVDALVELGHLVWVVDYAANKMCGPYQGQLWTDIDLSRIDEIDFVLAVGPGIPPGQTEMPEVISFLTNHFSVCWNSEPIKLEQYKSRILSQAHLFDVWATFDEGEVPEYSDNSLQSFFLPQAYNPKWYHPFENARPEKFACFVGSVGGKWQNRVHFLNRARRILGDHLTVQQTFNAEVVNSIYNQHCVVLNLGLHFEQLGAPTRLTSFAFQQRIFEAIGAGAVPMTNIPADLKNTPVQWSMFDNGSDIIYYTNDNFEAVIKYYASHPEKIANIRLNLLGMRHMHTYKARMQTLIENVQNLM